MSKLPTNINLLSKEQLLSLLEDPSKLEEWELDLTSLTPTQLSIFRREGVVGLLNHQLQLLSPPRTYTHRKEWKYSYSNPLKELELKLREQELQLKLEKKERYTSVINSIKSLNNKVDKLIEEVALLKQEIQKLTKEDKEAQK